MGTIADLLRLRVNSIMQDYERAIVDELPEMRRLTRAAIIDHLPEFLRALADWVQARLAGEVPSEPFGLLAEGHALQRLGFGLSLEALTHEYTMLRHVTLTNLAQEPLEVREVIALDLGMDEAVMESMRRYAAERDAARERFIGILGHDLRSPLAAISMGAEILLSADDASPREARVGARIASSVLRMRRMIDDVLDFARSHLGGGIPATPTRQDLGALCREAVDEAIAGAPGRAVQLELAGDLRGTWDGERVGQALGNLLANAIAHGADPIVVRAWQADDRATVFASVTNHGRPIPADALPHVFDPFRHGKSGGSRGIGLGLYIVQQIALAHGGRCTITSDADQTVATLAFPRVPVDETPDRP